MNYSEHETKQKDAFTTETSGLEIAVIGMAGRFPGASSIDEFWQNLQQSVESIVPLEDEQLLAQGVTAPTLADPDYIKVGGVLENTDLFDAAFFGYSPREAEILDPQQRLFLETAVEAIETAGYDAERYPGSIGVYGGAGMNGYLLNLYTSSAIRNSVSPYELFIANDKDFLTTRISYKLNLKGPSVDVQTACSSSLVAVHMACQSLLSGECDMALAGGVAISKQLGYRPQVGSIYSPDGHCRAFDAQAAGTVSGNGVGIVVLKRLEDALADGDTIDAVVKGSAINNDGALKVSYTAPCVEAQSAVIQAAQAMAEVDPRSISYVEAHGTGTALGDPIELAALTQAFAVGPNKPATCAVGSVKTNIGHLDAASGISGFIKTVLALKHQQIPASLHFQTINPQIDLDSSPFYINATLADWPQGQAPRRAGVSSFGIGGTNAHVVLEEAPTVVRAQPNEQPQLLVLSAKTPEALDLMALNLAGFLEKQCALADVAHTLQMGRSAFEYRRAIVCKTSGEAIAQLGLQTAQKAIEQSSTVFLFSGQGSQYINMAKGLYATESGFQEALDECAAILEDEGIDLISLLYPEGTVQKPTLREISSAPDLSLSQSLNQTTHTQPALFAVEYALTQLWKHWGITPTAMLGHSIGEYVAACLAGVFDLKTALKLVLLRGRLMQKMPSGTMLSVALGTEEIEPWLSDEITLAVSNSPQLCVLSGSEAAIGSLQSRLEENNISCRRLHTSHAFHSSMMEPMVEPFVTAVSQVTLHPPTIPFISTVTGTWITPEEATSPDYWGQQIRQTVRFNEGVKELLQLDSPLFLEVGPGHSLTTLTRQHFSVEGSTMAINSLPHPQSKQDDSLQMLTALGQLWSAGVTVDWKGVQGDRTPRRIPLPTYPFERQRYWVDFKGDVLNSPSIGGASPEENRSLLVAQTKPELKPDLADWFYSPSWERCLPTLKTVDPTERPCWLIFLDEAGVGQRLAQEIEKSGQAVFTVCRGEAFEQAGYRKFSLNPERSEEFQQLWDDLKFREMTPTEIVYLWATDDASEKFVTLMVLLQTCSQLRNAKSEPLQVTVATTATYDVVGSETIQPKQAAVQGLCQVIGQEYPTIGCRQVDWDGTNKTLQQLATILWKELRVASPSAVVAYRDRHRWQLTYQPIHLPKGTPTLGQIRLRKGGVYAIAGTPHQGLGKIWANHLAKHYEAHIVIIAATDTRTIKAELNQAVEKFGSINGVFVSSPTTDEKSAAPIALLQPHHWEHNRQTKQMVLENLAIALADHTPDFCCVQSSLSSIIGGLALAAYSGANHVIDAFVTQQNQTATFPWFSINWDASIEENAASDSQKEHSRNGQNASSGWGSTLANFALTGTEVWQATERILTQTMPGQTVVSKGDLLARYHQWIHATPQKSPARTEASQQNESQTTSYGRPQLSVAYASPENDIQKTIADIWQDLLGLEKVGIHDSFFDLGGHSLLAIQVISRLREAFPVAIDMRNLLFESPTVAKIAAVVAKQLPQDDELDEMAALLAEVQTLSTEEIQAQLAGGDA